MKTTNRPFQLEETVPGTFLLQGLLGGALGGFTCVVASRLWEGTADFIWTVFLTLFSVVAGSNFGFIKATIMWGFYRLTGVRMGALARVVVSSIGACLLAVFLNLQFESSEAEFPVWLIITLAPAIPTALFVGSSIKPWELFTFGSIVVDGQRVGSGSVLATLGTLPLRFVSLIALAVLILRYSCGTPKWEPLASPELDGVIFVSPLIYLAISAYLTFRSPRKVILPALGLLLNLYGFYAFIIFLSHTRTHWTKGWMVSAIFITFFIAWVVFLVARLAAPTDEVKQLTILPAASSRPNVVEHQCLGTRFLEWQKRVA
jgi:hypothetical protein